ncbi:hypothetical protein V6N12_030349 [Hibiscus sabdariffa]|uniref:Uncharacterized protein n=1 Tax=Hibiscus sabdariffa TaxID=183260 RepID=A0ABR2C0P1_9ROSI
MIVKKTEQNPQFLRYPNPTFLVFFISRRRFVARSPEFDCWIPIQVRTTVIGLEGDPTERGYFGSQEFGFARCESSPSLGPCCRCMLRGTLGNPKGVKWIGIAGGLALWWTNDVKLYVLLHDKNLIDTVISINGEDEWFGTFIYAPPYEEEKQEFWERLGTLRDDVNAKWCVMGDTNIVASPNEKYGGSPFDHNNARWFHEFFERSYLREIQSKGGAYTWSNQRCEEDEICEKLDRVLSSLEWSFLFPKAIVLIDVPVASNHAPIVLLTNGMIKKS